MHNYDLEVLDAIETTPKCRISVLDLFPVFPRNKIIFILIFLSDFMVLLGHDVEEATLDFRLGKYPDQGRIGVTML